MLGLYYLFGPLGLLLQGVAIFHFVKRRPDNFWLWIIIFGGWLGATVYIIAEVIPDARLMQGSFRSISRHGRVKELEQVVLDNPAPGNYEELGGLYLDEGKLAKARECFDKAITPRTKSPDPFYKRAIVALEVGDAAAAVADLEKVIGVDPKYDFHRALALLAQAYAQVGEPERAARAFEEVTKYSVLSETQYNYAQFLMARGRYAEARDWARRIVAKKHTLPSYLKRMERPWFRRAEALVKRLDKLPQLAAEDLPRGVARD